MVKRKEGGAEAHLFETVPSSAAIVCRILGLAIVRKKDNLDPYQWGHPRAIPTTADYCSSHTTRSKEKEARDAA